MHKHFSPLEAYYRGGDTDGRYLMAGRTCRVICYFTDKSLRPSILFLLLLLVKAFSQQKQKKCCVVCERSTWRVTLTVIVLLEKSESLCFARMHFTCTNLVENLIVCSGEVWVKRSPLVAWPRLFF